MSTVIFFLLFQGNFVLRLDCFSCVTAIEWHYSIGIEAVMYRYLIAYRQYGMSGFSHWKKEHAASNTLG